MGKNKEIREKVWGRRDYISFFLFSVLVGGAFKESLKIVNDLINKTSFSLSFAYLVTNWANPMLYSVIIFRFYIGNFLYLKWLSENKKSEILWSISFLIMLFQFTILMLMGLSIGSDLISKQKFFWLLFILLSSDLLWILFLYILKQISAKEDNHAAIPKMWFTLNSIGFLFLLISFLIFKENSYSKDSNLFFLVIFFLGLSFIDLHHDFFRLIRKTME